MLKITSHLPPPPPPHHTGKLKTGLSCHHSFNNDKRYYVASSIEKDVDRLIEDLDKAFAKYQVFTTLAQNLKLLKPERERSREKKSKDRRLNASNNRRKRACIIAGLPRARSARGTEPHTHGIWSTSFRLVVT